MNKIKINDKGTVEHATDIAGAVYELLQNYPAEEQWQSGSKLRSTAIDLLFYVSVAAADEDYVINQMDLRLALRNIQGLETMYIFAGRQQFYKIDPELVMQMKELRELLRTELKKARKSAENSDATDMENWMKKYNMWKEMKS